MCDCEGCWPPIGKEQGPCLVAAAASVRFAQECEDRHAAQIDEHKKLLAFLNNNEVELAESLGFNEVMIELLRYKFSHDVRSSTFHLGQSRLLRKYIKVSGIHVEPRQLPDDFEDRWYWQGVEDDMALEEEKDKAQSHLDLAVKRLKMKYKESCI